MKGFFGVILLIIGMINIMSGRLGLLGWVFAIVGAVILANSLSGPVNKRKHIGGGEYSGSDNSESGCSGSNGDCGGGGGD